MLRVLVADDERIALISTAHSFHWKKFGFDEPVCTTNPRQALEMLRTDHFDAAIVDIRMPEISGLDMIRICADEHIHTIFAVVSGYSDFDYVQTALRLQAIDYCLKPVVPQEAERVLSTLSTRILTERLTHDALKITAMDTPTDFSAFLQAKNIALPQEKICIALLSCDHIQNHLSLLPSFPSDIALFYDASHLILLSWEHKVELLNSLSQQTEFRSCYCNIHPDAISLARIYERLVSELNNVHPGQAPLHVHLQNSNDAFTQLLRYVDDHLNESLSLQELASLFHLNYTYCSELFRKVTGQTFTRYLTAHRIEHAVNLMLKTDMSITDIASAVGYGNYHHFSNTFKQSTGLSPAAYRQKGGRKNP